MFAAVTTRYIYYSTESAGINGYVIYYANCVADLVAKFINSTDDPKKKNFYESGQIFTGPETKPSKNRRKCCRSRKKCCRFRKKCCRSRGKSKESKLVKNVADLVKNISDLVKKVADLVKKVADLVKNVAVLADNVADLAEYEINFEDKIKNSKLKFHDNKTVT